MSHIREAFIAGYQSELGDMTPMLTGQAREAWYIGAYFMRAELDMPRRIERGPIRNNRRTICVDGAFYYNESCDVGTRTVRITE